MWPGLLVQLVFVSSRQNELADYLHMSHVMMTLRPRVHYHYYISSGARSRTNHELTTPGHLAISSELKCTHRPNLGERISWKTRERMNILGRKVQVLSVHVDKSCREGWGKTSELDGGEFTAQPLCPQERIPPCPTIIQKFIALLWSEALYWDHGKKHHGRFWWSQRLATAFLSSSPPPTDLWQLSQIACLCQRISLSAFMSTEWLHDWTKIQAVQLEKKKA